MFNIASDPHYFALFVCLKIALTLFYTEVLNWHLDCSIILMVFHNLTQKRKSKEVRLRRNVAKGLQRILTMDTNKK